MSSPNDSLPSPAIPLEVLRVLASQPAPITDDERAALARLIRNAQSDTGQSARCANFLLAWWNASNCGGFDLTDAWAVDDEISRDMVAVFALVARHRHYPSAYVDREVFVNLVYQWRPHLKA